MDNTLPIRLWKRRGVDIVSSGTTGDPKQIYRSPENLKACNEVAIDVQMLTSKSKVYTCTKMDHAGGLLLQTLPAYTLGCDIHITKFNPYQFLKEFENYTHTFLPPKMCQSVMKTKGYSTCDLTGKIVAMGSDRIMRNEIEAFVNKGATVIANWGMSEVGPNVINKTFSTGNPDLWKPYWIEQQDNIMGDKFYCDTKIDADGELLVKGDISIYGNEWFATGDLVVKEQGCLYYIDRKI